MRKPNTGQRLCVRLRPRDATNETGTASGNENAAGADHRVLQRVVQDESREQIKRPRLTCRARAAKKPGKFNSETTTRKRMSVSLTEISGSPSCIEIPFVYGCRIDARSPIRSSITAEFAWCAGPVRAKAVGTASGTPKLGTAYAKGFHEAMRDAATARRKRQRSAGRSFVARVNDDLGSHSTGIVCQRRSGERQGNCAMNASELNGTLKAAMEGNWPPDGMILVE